jgi:excisionase family DNA binding protein
VSDLTLARHLHQALRNHRRRVELAGHGVPPALRELEELAAFRVMTGQDSSISAGSSDQGDSEAVTPRALTLRQVGDALGGVSDSTVKRAIASKQLRAVHIGRSVRVLITDLDDYLGRLSDAASDGRTPAA